MRGIPNPFKDFQEAEARRLFHQDRVAKTEALSTRVTVLANTLADEYLTMFTDYIKPVLWHSTYSAYLRESNVIAKNGGTFTNQPDNATASDLEAIKYVSKNAQSKADVYISRLERYLCDTNVEEYTQSQDNDFDVKPSFDVNTVSGWYFGNGDIQRPQNSGSSEDALLLE